MEILNDSKGRLLPICCALSFRHKSLKLIELTPSRVGQSKRSHRPRRKAYLRGAKLSYRPSFTSLVKELYFDMSQFNSKSHRVRDFCQLVDSAPGTSEPPELRGNHQVYPVSGPRHPPQRQQRYYPPIREEHTVSI